MSSQDDAKKRPEQRGTKWPMPTEVLKREVDELKQKLGDMERRYEELQSEYARFREVAGSTIDAGIAYGEEVKRLEKVVVELTERDRILTILENGGVDNWGGYDAAFENAEAMEEED